MTTTCECGHERSVHTAIGCAICFNGPLPKHCLGFTAPATDSRDTDLFAITNAELSRAVTLFHELDEKRKNGMTTANMLRVILTDLLTSRAASVPEES